MQEILYFSCDKDLTTTFVCLNMRPCVCACVCLSVTITQFTFPINHLYQESTFSSINYLINHFYSSLAQLIATFKTFRFVKSVNKEKERLLLDTVIEYSKSR